MNGQDRLIQREVILSRSRLLRVSAHRMCEHAEVARDWAQRECAYGLFLSERASRLLNAAVDRATTGQDRAASRALGRDGPAGPPGSIEASSRPASPVVGVRRAAGSGLPGD
jgi:hypothetical protein